MVATPIGNLGDMSPRAVEILAKVDRIAAEDTRHSAGLLRHFAINTPMLALHEHNEARAAQELVKRLQAGENIALISDAGTPLISDPGYILAQRAHEAGIQVVPVPGPSALIAALSVSGLPTDRFVFEGFLPAKASARRKRLDELAGETRTLAFYEAPHRILETVDDMISCFGGGREVVLARELTKAFETLLAGTLAEVKERMLADSNQQRGEFVVLVHGAQKVSDEDLPEATLRLLQVLVRELPVKQAAQIVAEVTGQKKNRLYQIALEMSQSQ